MRTWAERVQPSSIVTSPSTSSQAAAMTPVSAAASPKTTCVWRGMANVCRRPNAMPSPTMGSPLFRAPRESAVCQGYHLHEMVAMGQVQAVPREERTANIWVLVPVEACTGSIPVEAEPGSVPVEGDPGMITATAVGAMRGLGAVGAVGVMVAEGVMVAVRAMRGVGVVVMVADGNRHGFCTIYIYIYIYIYMLYTSILKS